MVIYVMYVHVVKPQDFDDLMDQGDSLYGDDDNDDFNEED